MIRGSFLKWKNNIDTSKLVVRMLNDIGHKIRCIRKENNFKKVQFAKSIRISQGNLSEIELGNSNPLQTLCP